MQEHAPATLASCAMLLHRETLDPAMDTNHLDTGALVVARKVPHLAAQSVHS